MKHIREIHMKTDAQWLFSAESVAPVVTLLHEFFYKDHNKECPPTRIKQFFDVVFEKIIVNVWQYLLIYGIS